MEEPATRALAESKMMLFKNQKTASFQNNSSGSRAGSFQYPQLRKSK